MKASRRYYAAFTLTAFIYTVSSLALWYVLTRTTHFSLANRTKESLRITLSTIRPLHAVTPAVSPSQNEATKPPQRITPEPTREREVQSRTQETVKPTPPPLEPKPSIRSKPKPQKKSEQPAKPKQKKATKVHRTVTKKPVHQAAKKSRRRKKVATDQRRIARKHSKRTVTKKSASSAASVQSSAQKQAFLARLRRRIESHKYYPPVAKRRGMQGTVKVRFRILANGRLSALQVSGSRLFLRSAKEAVRAAFPVSTKHAGVRFPLDVSLTLHYRLR